MPGSPGNLHASRKWQRPRVPVVPRRDCRRRRPRQGSMIFPLSRPWTGHGRPTWLTRLAAGPAGSRCDAAAGRCRCPCPRHISHVRGGAVVDGKVVCRPGERGIVHPCAAGRRIVCHIDIPLMRSSPLVGLHGGRVGRGQQQPAQQRRYGACRRTDGAYLIDTPIQICLHLYRYAYRYTPPPPILRPHLAAGH